MAEPMEDIPLSHEDKVTLLLDMFPNRMDDIQEALERHKNVNDAAAYLTDGLRRSGRTRNPVIQQPTQAEKAKAKAQSQGENPTKKQRKTSKKGNGSSSTDVGSSSTDAGLPASVLEYIPEFPDYKSKKIINDYFGPVNPVNTVFRIRLRTPAEKSEHKLTEKILKLSKDDYKLLNSDNDKRYSYLTNLELNRYLFTNKKDMVYKVEKFEEALIKIQEIPPPGEKSIAGVLSGMLTPLWKDGIYGSFTELREGSDVYINRIWQEGMEGGTPKIMLKSETSKNCDKGSNTSYGSIGQINNGNIVCLACGCEILSDDKTKQCDHLIPVIQAYISIKPGANIHNELSYLHQSCNSKKSDMSIVEFITAMINNEFPCPPNAGSFAFTIPQRIEIIRKRLNNLDIDDPVNQITRIDELEKYLKLRKIRQLTRYTATKKPSPDQEAVLLRLQYQLKFNTSFEPSFQDITQMKIFNDEISKLEDELNIEKAAHEETKLRRIESSERHKVTRESLIREIRDSDEVLTKEIQERDEQISLLQTLVNQNILDADKAFQMIKEKNERIDHIQNHKGQKIQQLQTLLAEERLKHEEMREEGRGLISAAYNLHGPELDQFLSEAGPSLLFGKSIKSNKIRQVAKKLGLKYKTVPINKLKQRIKKVSILARRYRLKLNKSVVGNIKKIINAQRVAKSLKIRITKKVRGKRMYKTLKELNRQIKSRRSKTKKKTNKKTNKKTTKSKTLKKLQLAAKKRKIRITKQVRGKRVYLTIAELRKKM